MAVNPIPEGFHSVTPYLIVQEVPKLLDFLKQAFKAHEIMRMPAPDGTIAHAEVRIGDSPIMMGEAHGDFKPMPGSIYLYVDDTDATYQRALQGRRDFVDGAGEPVLWRPQRECGRSRRQSLVDRHPYRRSAA